MRASAGGVRVTVSGRNVDRSRPSSGVYGGSFTIITLLLGPHRESEHRPRGVGQGFSGRVVEHDARRGESLRQYAAVRRAVGHQSQLHHRRPIGGEGGNAQIVRLRRRCTIDSADWVRWHRHRPAPSPRRIPPPCAPRNTCRNRPPRRPTAAPGPLTSTSACVPGNRQRRLVLAIADVFHVAIENVLVELAGDQLRAWSRAEKISAAEAHHIQKPGLILRAGI